jgi:hypothetical protein
MTYLWIVHTCTRHIGAALLLSLPVDCCFSKFLNYFWQESHKNERKPCELLVLFSSCGILSAGSRTDNRPWPRQTLPEPHDFTMTSFTSTTLPSPNDGSHLQQKPSHIIPQGPHHHQELFKSSSRGLQWDFCWNPLRSDQDLGFKTSFEPRLVHL